MDKEAKSVSLSALSEAVSKAVAIEQQRSVIGPSFTANHPIIMGRRFDGKLDMAEAEQLAIRITQQVEQSDAVENFATQPSGKKLEPAFLWQDGYLTCGFVAGNPNPFSE